MNEVQSLLDTMTWLLPLIIILSIWDAVWRFIALWRSARNNHLAWFVCIAIFNTVGILPIIYLLMHRNFKSDESASS